MRGDTFNHTELAILWMLKRRKGKVVRGKKGTSAERSCVTIIANEIGKNTNTVRYSLAQLEQNNIVLRTYPRPKADSFGEDGNNPMLKVELVDPKMYLPPLKQTPLGVVVAQENRDLDERTAHEPSVDAIVSALVDRLEEYQKQVNKLQDIVEALTSENEKLRRRVERPKPSEHLTSRVRDVLTPEQWEELRHRTEGGAS